MKCPVTNTPLIVVERDKIELDYSPASKGIWFDAGELELFFDSLGVDADLRYIASLPVYKTDEKKYKSPRTGKYMDKVNLCDENDPIIIDRDRDGLGLWFDAGELTRIFEKYAKKAPESGEEKIIKFLGEIFRF
jgi:Zn-finger nucleic acid-binding protein